MVGVVNVYPLEDIGSQEGFQVHVMWSAIFFCFWYRERNFIANEDESKNMTLPCIKCYNPLIAHSIQFNL